MDYFDEYVRQIKSEKKKRTESFKKSKKRTKALEIICKGLDVFSKGASDGTIEEFLRERR